MLVVFLLVALVVFPLENEGCSITVCHVECKSYLCDDSVGFSNETTSGFLSELGLNVSVSSIPYPNATDRGWFVLAPSSTANLSDIVNTARALGYSFLLAYPPSGEYLSLSNEAKNMHFAIAILGENPAISLQNVTLQWSVVNISLSRINYYPLSLTYMAIFSSLIPPLIISIFCCQHVIRRVSRFNRRYVGVYTPLNNATRQEQINRIRNHLAELQAQVNNVQMPLGALETHRLPTKQFVTAKNEANTCGICIADFEAGDTTRILPCHHYFHKECIDEWLIKYSCVCPMCKTVVPRQIVSV